MSERTESSEIQFTMCIPPEEEAAPALAPGATYLVTPALLSPAPGVLLPTPSEGLLKPGSSSSRLKSGSFRAIFLLIDARRVLPKTGSSASSNMASSGCSMAMKSLERRVTFSSPILASPKRGRLRLVLVIRGTRMRNSRALDRF